MKRPIIWDITPYSPSKVYQRFGGTCASIFWVEEWAQISKVFLLGLIFDPENVGCRSTDYTVLYYRTKKSSIFIYVSFNDSVSMPVHTVSNVRIFDGQWIEKDAEGSSYGIKAVSRNLPEESRYAWKSQNSKQYMDTAVEEQPARRLNRTNTPNSALFIHKDRHCIEPDPANMACYVPLPISAGFVPWPFDRLGSATCCLIYFEGPFWNGDLEHL
jgi:hypothetical protein